MLRFALLRILGAIPTLLVVIVVAFMLVHAAPGGPFDSERVLLPEVEQNILRAYHLDEPLPQQFSRYLRGVLRGDFGPSYTHPEYDVSEIIFASYPVSFFLTAWSLVIALVLGVLFGLDPDGSLAPWRWKSNTKISIRTKVASIVQVSA